MYEQVLNSTIIKENSNYFSIFGKTWEIVLLPYLSIRTRISCISDTTQITMLKQDRGRSFSHCRKWKARSSGVVTTGPMDIIAAPSLCSVIFRKWLLFSRPPHGTEWLLYSSHHDCFPGKKKGRRQRAYFPLGLASFYFTWDIIDI